MTYSCTIHFKGATMPVTLRFKDKDLNDSPESWAQNFVSKMKTLMGTMFIVDSTGNGYSIDMDNVAYVEFDKKICKLLGANDE